jgi:hypothetical protein
MGKLIAIRLQNNPDGKEGHEERERYQESSKQFPAKRKYTGGEQHQFTKPPVANVTKKQARALQRLEMKENCEDYTELCKRGNCQFCATRDERTKKVIEKAKVLIDKFEKHSTGTEFQEDYLR